MHVPPSRNTPGRAPETAIGAAPGQTVLHRPPPVTSGRRLTGSGLDEGLDCGLNTGVDQMRSGKRLYGSTELGTTARVA